MYLSNIFKNKSTVTCGMVNIWIISMNFQATRNMCLLIVKTISTSDIKIYFHRYLKYMNIFEWYIILYTGENCWEIFYFGTIFKKFQVDKNNMTWIVGIIMEFVRWNLTYNWLKTFLKGVTFTPCTNT